MPQPIEPHNQMPPYQRTREMTLDDMLLENRIIFMIGEISYRLSTEVIMKMLYLDNLKRGTEISLYLNSPGGSVDDTMAIYDTMQFIKPDVSTICVGSAMSMGALLLAGGAKGKRFALPNARVLIHQVAGGYEGQATDIEIHAKEVLNLRHRLDEIIADHTGQEIDKVRRDTERDYFMSAAEAKEYGIIDDVIAHR